MSNEQKLREALQAVVDAHDEQLKRLGDKMRAAHVSGLTLPGVAMSEFEAIKQARKAIALPPEQATAQAVPEGYALISVDALQAWKKLDEVKSACVYPTTKQPAQAVPGWKLVPIEPTQEMIDAMPPVEEVGYWAMYSAALAAAPTPPAGSHVLTDSRIRGAFTLLILMLDTIGALADIPGITEFLKEETPRMSKTCKGMTGEDLITWAIGAIRKHPPATDAGVVEDAELLKKMTSIIETENKYLFDGGDTYMVARVAAEKCLQAARAKEQS